MIKKTASVIADFFLYPLPSLFDVIVALGIIPIGFLHPDYQGIYLVWFSIFLLIASTFAKQNRIYRSRWVMYLLIWCFLSVFLHSWFVNPSRPSFKWINFQLMSEGFIYILFGVLIFKTIVERSFNSRLLYITIPIAMIPWLTFSSSHGQVSLIFSFMISVVIYLFMTGRKKIAWRILFVILLCTIINIKYIAMKWACRPYVWIGLLNSIRENFFFGTGFEKYLVFSDSRYITDNMMWIKQIGKVTYGWIYRHNDYLSIASFLGAPVILPIYGLIKELLIRFKRTVYLIPFMAFCILCFVQITMACADKALIIIVSTALFYTET